MSGIEIYLVGLNVILMGVIYIMGRGLVKAERAVASLKQYAGFVTEFAITNSFETPQEAMKEFHGFIDRKFKEEE